MAKQNINHYSYTGENFFIDLVNLREELFVTSKNKEIKLEQSLKKRNVALGMAENLSVSFVIFEHEETPIIMSLVTGLDKELVNEIYEKHSFRQSKKEDFHIWEKAYYGKSNTAPMREGISVEVYDNKADWFVFELER